MSYEPDPIHLFNNYLHGLDSGPKLKVSLWFTEFTLIGVRQAQSCSLALHQCFPALTFSLWEKGFQAFQKIADNPLKTWKTSQWVMFGGMLISTDN